MNHLSYCLECRRISYFNGTCNYCQSGDIKAMDKKTPVNVMGTKIKGRFMNYKDGMADILCAVEGKRNEKMVRQVEIENLRKIL